MKRLGYQQVGEKQGVSTVCQLTFSWMETDHGQIQGNCVPTPAGAAPPWQGNIAMAHWCTQISMNFTAESSKGNRTHSLVWILTAQKYLPRAATPSQCWCWVWQPEEEEEEEGRNLSWNQSQTCPKNKAVAPDARTPGGSWGRQVPGTQGQTGNFVSQTSPVPIPLGGKKSCQQSWPKNKANKAWISGESNNPRAANKVKLEERKLAAGRWWLLRAHVQPLGSHLVFILPEPKANPPKSPGITTITGFSQRYQVFHNNILSAPWLCSCMSQISFTITRSKRIFCFKRLNSGCWHNLKADSLYTMIRHC